MKRLLWSIPAIAIYFYTATVLTEYGFASYFGVSSNFIEASLKDNIIYFYQLFILTEGVAGMVKWWAWAIIGVAALIIVASCYLSSFARGWFTFCGTALLFFCLMGFYTFGHFLAANTDIFLVPLTNCPSASQDTIYIIPVIDNGQAVLVPINQNNNMIGGFLVKNLTDLSCGIEYKNIGLIKN